jgi:hypothetical protein
VNKDRISSLIHAYVNGVATPGEAKQVEAAVEQDADLRAQLDEARKLHDLIGSMGAPKASQGFASRVVALSRASSRARDLRAKRSFWPEFMPRGRKLALSLVAHAAVLAILGFIVFHGESPREVPPVIEIPSTGNSAVTARYSAPSVAVDLAATAEIDVTPLGVDGMLHVVISEEKGRRMLVAFTRAQISEQAEVVRFTATPVFVKDGKFKLPPYLLQEGLACANKIIVLRLSDRIEIWRSESFNGYLEDNRFSLPSGATI